MTDSDFDLRDQHGVSEGPVKPGLNDPSRDDAPQSSALSLDELIAQIENDPSECRNAFDGLESIDRETRLRIIEDLALLTGRPGADRLLGLLEGSRDEATREAARLAREMSEDRATSSPDSTSEPALAKTTEATAIALGATSWLAASLVTPVNGDGRGVIGLSVAREGLRQTAIFLCDVERGVIDAEGRTEDDSPGAGGLIREAREGTGEPGLPDAHALALRLLSGSLGLNGETLPAHVREWVEKTLGSGFSPRHLTISLDEAEVMELDGQELLRRSGEILEACPTWLDRSSLTVELAEEIRLREGAVAVDPSRDSGAFRYLFEHRLLRRLEHYRRLLYWMAGFWQAARDEALAASARAIALRLSDEQFAVPSNPFVVALTVRSLNAALEALAGRDDSSPPRGLHES